MIFPFQLPLHTKLEKENESKFLYQKFIWMLFSWIYSDRKWCTDSFLSFEQWIWQVIFRLLYYYGWNCELLQMRWNMLYFVFGKDVKHFIPAHFVEYMKGILWHQKWFRTITLFGWLIKVLGRVNHMSSLIFAIFFTFFFKHTVASIVPDKAEAILQLWSDRDQDRSHERFFGQKRLY